MQPSESSNKVTGQSTDRLSIMTDEELATWVSRAAVGSREYQKRIYDLVAARSYRVIRKIVGESHADDVMQDFVIHLFAKLGQFRFESSLETWAHRMAVNQSLQYVRKLKREEQRIQKASLSAEVSTAANPQSHVEDVEMLERALEQISGEQRAILHMKEVEGLAYAVIAKILGIPEGTVGSRLNNARNALRNSLIQLGWEL
jgi:RNA polymerase sigma-70 factor (ECF subfamily)